MKLTLELTDLYIFIAPAWPGYFISIPDDGAGQVRLGTGLDRKPGFRLEGNSSPDVPGPARAGIGLGPGTKWLLSFVMNHRDLCLYIRYLSRGPKPAGEIAGLTLCFSTSQAGWPGITQQACHCRVMANA